MKAALMEGPQQMLVKDLPRPVPESREVLVRVKACAICGSDLTVYKMGLPERVLGHEFAGEIVEIGSLVQDWKIGDRVVVEPSIVCGECYWCRHQKYNLCDALGYTGLATDGGLAEYARVPVYQLHHLPDAVSYEQGALIEPLSVALRGVNFAGTGPEDKVAVFGCGAVGLFAMLWARSLGVKQIVAIDVVQSRLAAACKLADTCLNSAEKDVSVELTALMDDLGPDVIFECSGHSRAQSEAVNAVRKGGRVILLGMGYDTTEISFMQLTMKEVCLKGSLGYNSRQGQGEFRDTIAALKNKKIDPLTVPVQKFNLNEVGRVFESLLHGEIVKAIMVP
jgi:L-iditol 2-dehydrogenase